MSINNLNENEHIVLFLSVTKNEDTISHNKFIGLGFILCVYKTCVTVQIYQFSYVCKMLKLTLKVLKHRFYYIFVHTVKKLLLKLHCATKYSTVCTIL